jgi:hypothetical protein
MELKYLLSYVGVIIDGDFIWMIGFIAPYPFIARDNSAIADSQP